MLKVDETPNMCPNLNDQQQLRLNKINKVQNYFMDETRKRKLTSKTLSKCIASFDYFHESLIVLSATSGGISIASFATVIGASVGIASFSFAFSVTTGIVQKSLKITRNKKKKHSKTVVLARSKLNSMESKISEALIDNEISHEDFTTIINEAKIYRELKVRIRMMESKKSDTEKTNLIVEGKKRGVNETIRPNNL